VVTASQLTPQAFKNSSQNSSFQDTFNSQNTPSTNSNQSLLYVTPSTTTLRVETGQNPAVLSATKTVGVQNTATVNTTNNYLPITFVVLFVSIMLAVYFFRKYKELSDITEALEVFSSEE
jgi:hypothetical protein